MSSVLIAIPLINSAVSLIIISVASTLMVISHAFACGLFTLIIIHCFVLLSRGRGLRLRGVSLQFEGVVSLAHHFCCQLFPDVYCHFFDSNFHFIHSHSCFIDLIVFQSIRLLLW